MPLSPTPSLVCNWLNTSLTPFTYTTSTGTSVGIWLQGPTQLEKITTATELQLELNKTYIISFDYLVAPTSPLLPSFSSYSTPPIIKIGLTNNITNGALPSSAEIIAQATSPSPSGYDVLSTSGVNGAATYPDGSIFNHFETGFVYSGGGKYLNVSGTNPSWEPLPGVFFPLGCHFFIDNISIKSCDAACAPNPSFTYSIDGCTVIFNSDTNPSVVNHFWDFGDGITSNQENPIHTYPVVGGTFTVTHEITNACGTFVEPKTVIIATPPCPGFTASTDQCQVTFSPICQGGTHFWDFGDGTTFTGLNPPPHIYPGIGGTFTVTHKIIAPNCGTFETQIVTPACTLSCNCPSGAITLNNTQTSLSALIGGVLPANPSAPLNIIVTNQLVFDQTPSGSNYQTYNFPVGSNICMMPNARLVINAGNAVTLNKTNVKSEGCTKLWSDITIQPGGKLSVLNYSTIQDGTLGVVVSPSSVFTSTNSTYNNNFISVRINPFTGAVGTPMNVGINGNTFTSSGSILPGNFIPPNGSLIPNLGATPWTGIFSEHVGMLFVKDNKFKSLSNGIVSIGQSNVVSVSSSSFQGMAQNSQNTGYGQLRGYGLYARNGLRIVVNGFGQNGPLAFSNCRTSVYTDNTWTTDVQNCNMAGIQNAGVECRNATTSTFVLVKSNSIACNAHGVALYNLLVQGLSKSQIRILENSFAINNGGNGVLASGVNANGRAHVLDNTISLTNGGVGVNMFSSKGINVKANTISLQQSGAESYGIRLENCTDNQVDCNSITGMGSSQANHYGIRMEESSTNKISCNPISDTGTGVLVYGTCDGSQIRGNTLSNHITGILYSNFGNPNNPVFAITGEQKWRSNEWSNGGSVGAVHEGNPSLSKFLIQTSSGSFWPNSPSPSTGWFSYEDPNTNPDPNTPIFNCPSDLDACNISGLVGDGPCSDKSFELSVANGQTSGGIYEPAWTWMKKRYLYRNIKEDCADLLNQEAAFGSFYNANTNSTVGKFYATDNKTREAFELISTEMSALDNYEVQADDLLANLADVRQQIFLSGELPNLMQQLNQYLSDMESLSISFSTYVGNLKTDQLTDINVAATDNTAITTSQSFEANEKAVNAIYFNTLAAGNSDFTVTQLTQLQTLANQCPYAGGTAVFKARAMLGGDYFANYDDKLLCRVSDGHLRLPSDGQWQSASFVAYPNPAKNEITLSFEPRGEEGTLTVLDVFGRQIEERQILGKTVGLSLQTDTWQNGIYFFRLAFDDENPFTQSIIISH